MSIKLTIHSMDTKNKSAVVTLVDGVYWVIYKKNMSIQLNEDGTSANTIWLNEFIKDRVFSARLSRLVDAEQIKDDIV